MKSATFVAAAMIALTSTLCLAQSQPTSPPSGTPTADLAVHLDQPSRPISPDLFGIFFEDINYAADGGLYAELIQNRSFEYSDVENLNWNAFTPWQLVMRGKGRGKIAVDIGIPLNANNPHYAMLEVTDPGEGVGLMNPGFDGIPVKTGESYHVALFASQRYQDHRWGGPPPEKWTIPMHLVARLERADGSSLGEAAVDVQGMDWRRYTATITATGADAAARFMLLGTTRGGVALDDISVFPQQTFKNRPNGLRADLAQTIADLHPKFVRFPGGCLTHGDGVGNIYRWKDSIGPTQERRGQPNLWGYHQSVGLGYFEYFQFCEDIGAKPLPVLAAGVSCQNSGHTAGIGQQAIPLDQMPAYIQDVLDLVEWANGPASSAWGAKRAAAGHPEPFHLEYLGIGNEDAMTPEFHQRFEMIEQAVRAKYPGITVVGTVGPFPDGPDFDKGWKIADELKVPVVDEHYYEPPAWFLGNLARYDHYDRARSHVYVGEYASRSNTLGSALAEAAYMCNLERNGDVVRMASYAPLLARIGHTQWNPDLIYFDGTRVYPTVNYYVQKLFATNAGDRYVPSTLSRSPKTAQGEALTCSTVEDSQSGDVVVKIANVSPSPVKMLMRFVGLNGRGQEAELTVLTGDLRAQDTPAHPEAIVPATSTLQVEAETPYEAPANSLTVLRIKGAKTVR